MQAINEKNIAIVCNPWAGNGRALALAEKIFIALAQRKIPNTIFKETWPADFNEFTEVYIAGGDGTLNYFINHYPQIKIPLTIFKGGSGNDFHWLLFGNKSFKEQLEIVLSNNPKPIDAGKCNGRLFINGVGIGFDGSVARSLTGKKKLPGKTSFLFAVLRKIFFYRSEIYHISSSEMEEENRKLLINVTNGRRAGGGFHIAPQAAADDGWLDVITIEVMNPFKRLRWLPVVEKGKHLKLPFIQYFKTKKICISSKKPMLAHLDGEYCSDQKMEIEIIPEKFLFLC